MKFKVKNNTPVDQAIDIVLGHWMKTDKSVKCKVNKKWIRVYRVINGKEYAIAFVNRFNGFVHRPAAWREAWHAALCSIWSGSEVYDCISDYSGLYLNPNHMEQKQCEH